MSQIDLHNVLVFLIIFILLVLIRFAKDFGFWFGAASGVVTFVLLAGRVVAHGGDIRRRHPDDWLSYVTPNVAASFLTFALFAF